MDLDRIGRQPFLLCAVALILALCGCSPYTMGARGLPVLPVGATAAVSEVPYVVTGTTVPEIRLSLRTAATAALGNSATSRRVGLHRSWLGYRYRFAQQGVSCQITEVTIELESTIQVPRWTDREAADLSSGRNTSRRKRHHQRRRGPRRRR